MAGLSNTEELRREIQLLAAENEELKQMVQLLQESQHLRTSLHREYSEAGALAPLHESSRLDGSDLVDSGSFRLAGAQLSTPPMTPVGPGPVFMGQLPLGGRLDSTPLSPHPPQMFTPPPLSPGAAPFVQTPPAPRAQRMMQQFPFPLQGAPVARLNLRSPPQNLLRWRAPPTPDSGMQGAGFITPDGSGQEFNFRGNVSPARPRARGYCSECAVPYHPHIAQPDSSLADSVLSARMNQSSSYSEGSSQDSSLG